MRFIPYNKSLKEFSRELRNHSTKSEIILWNQLKGRQVLGFQFNRQKPLGRYIVDFYCKPLNLVIEIDGITHDSEEAQRNDAKRQEALEKTGLRFLRFGDREVVENLEGVLKRIEDFIKKSH